MGIDWKEVSQVARKTSYYVIVAIQKRVLVAGLERGKGGEYQSVPECSRDRNYRTWKLSKYQSRGQGKGQGQLAGVCFNQLGE